MDALSHLLHGVQMEISQSSSCNTEFLYWIFEVKVLLSKWLHKVYMATMNHNNTQILTHLDTM